MNKVSYKSQTVLSRLLNLDILNFLLGLGITVILPAVLIFGRKWHYWLVEHNELYSIIGIFFVYILTYISINKFVSYLGSLGFRTVIPVCLFWLSLILVVMLAFRLQYSVYYLMLSSVFILIFFSLIRLLKNNYHHRVVAYIPAGRLGDLPVLDSITWKKLVDTKPINKDHVDIVMADLRADLSDEWVHFLATCTLRHIPVYHSSRLTEMVAGRVKIDHLYENDLGSLLPSKIYQTTKRVLDVFLVLMSLPLVLPIMVLTALLIAIESKGRVIFSQERVGQGGRGFVMYKFRSMYTGTDVDKTTSSQDSRVTKVGGFIRKTRIDELPQFYNVLRGDMSLIGPRAEFYKFAEEYQREIPFYSYRHIVKPGISGWAQVVQGYNFGVDETKIKLEYDFYYIKNFSFSMDLLIFFKTIQTVLTGFGAR